MKTSKPISTISYNSEQFLRERIWYLKKIGFIEYGMWIRHEPDVDGKKAHYHVYLQPAQLIQTEDLMNRFIELDSTWKPLDDTASDEEKKEHEKKRYLKCNVFRSSSADDWIPYGIHDEAYLAEKGLTRNVHYDIKDIQSTCDDTLLEMVSSAYDKRNNKLEFRIVQAVNEGKSWAEIVRSGMIPIRHITGARLLYMALTGQEKIS